MTDYLRKCMNGCLKNGEKGEYQKQLVYRVQLNDESQIPKIGTGICPNIVNPDYIYIICDFTMEEKTELPYSSGIFQIYISQIHQETQAFEMVHMVPKTLLE